MTTTTDLYLHIIEPLGLRAKEKNATFREEYGKKITVLAEQFFHTFCRADGSIDWETIVRYNSGTKTTRRTKNCPK